MHLKSFVDYAVVRGIHSNQITNGMRPSSAFTGESFVTAKEFYRTLGLINNDLQDAYLGICAGEFMSLNALGLIYQISLNATTVQEALYYLNNYLQATLPLVEMEVHEKKTGIGFKLTVANNESPYNRILLEALLTVIKKEGMLMTNENCVIVCTSPFYDDAYPADWQAGRSYSLSANPVKLTAAMRSHSKWRLEELVPAYLGFIEGLKPEQSFSAKVKMTALNLANPALPSQTVLAQTLNLTVQTCQRRLAAENLSFRQVYDDLMRQLSAFFAQHKDFSVFDVSDILGYSESAAYIRAFKRWHGNTSLQFQYALS